MKWTNRYGLPQPLVKAVCNPDYDRGECDYSITQLLSPPRISALKKLHADKLETDVSENIWALCGTIGHGILAKGSEGEVTEKRFFATLDGKVISGQMDYADKGEGLDWKFVSTWVAKGGLKRDHEEQCNGYVWLAGKNGVVITSYKIVYIFRDFRKNEATRDRDYPQSQVMVLDVPIWPTEQTEAFFRNRIKLHQEAQKTLPLCTKEEKWAKDDSWAIIKGSNIRATKVYYSEALAQAHLQSAGSGYKVSFRPGVDTRCEDWCPVSKWCDQFLATKPATVKSKEAF